MKKHFQNKCYVCVYLYIHNKYKQYTHIYFANNFFILDAINRLRLIVTNQIKYALWLWQQ